jgi:hypothetical protein
MLETRVVGRVALAPSGFGILAVGTDAGGCCPGGSQDPGQLGFRFCPAPDLRLQDGSLSCVPPSQAQGSLPGRSHANPLAGMVGVLTAEDAKSLCQTASLLQASHGQCFHSLGGKHLFLMKIPRGKPLGKSRPLSVPAIKLGKHSVFLVLKACELGYCFSVLIPSTSFLLSFCFFPKEVCALSPFLSDRTASL